MTTVVGIKKGVVSILTRQLLSKHPNSEAEAATCVAFVTTIAEP